jgi:hypothetical protein
LLWGLEFDKIIVRRDIMLTNEAIKKLIAIASSKNWKFWISAQKKSAAIRELAQHANEINHPVLIYETVRAFSRFPEKVHGAVPILRKWIRYDKGILDSKTRIPGEAGVLAGIRSYAAMTLGFMGSPAKESLDDLRRACTAESDNMARMMMEEAIERIEEGSKYQM